MTGQDLLTQMELANAELQNQTSEQDVTRSLNALNVAQDHFEALVAERAKTWGSTTGTLTQTNGVEYTAYPSGVLRLDRLQFVNPSTLRPAWDIVPLDRTGGHTSSLFWPYNLLTSATPGAPRAYWTNGLNIYWDPLPDTANQVRWYGFQTAPDIAVGVTFAYPDFVAFPIAAFAAKILKISLDDDAGSISDLANSFMAPALDIISRFDRDRAPGLSYTQIHEA